VGVDPQKGGGKMVYHFDYPIRTKPVSFLQEEKNQEGGGIRCVLLRRKEETSFSVEKER